MEIDESSLFPLIQDVINGNPNPVHFVWTAIIHVNPTGENIEPLKVVAVDIRVDYETMMTEHINVTLAVLGGTYANQIYPFQNDLEITLIKTPLGEEADVINNEMSVNARRLQATLIDKGDPQLLGQTVNSASQEALDLNNVLNVEFQLLDKSIEQLRMISVGGIWRRCTVGEFLRSALTQYAQTAQVDESIKLQGVDLVDPNNTVPRDHILIPHGTQLLDIPDYVQQKCGGVFSSGMGSFIRDRYWHLFPLLDTSDARFNAAKDLVTVIIVPPNRFSNLERTYRQDPGNLVILATGDVQFRGDSTVQQLSQGNGVRYADANKIMEGFATPKDGKVTAARAEINSEFVSVKRPNGLNNVQMAKAPITANPFLQASELARRNGSIIALTWENSNDELLTPAMMANVLFLVNDQVRSFKGVLLKHQTTVKMNGIGLTSGRHLSETGLSIFVANTPQ